MDSTAPTDQPTPTTPVRAAGTSSASKPMRLEVDDTLTEQGDEGNELYLLLDGVLAVEIDGDTVAEIGPGAILLSILLGGVVPYLRVVRLTPALAMRAA